MIDLEQWNARAGRRRQYPRYNPIFRRIDSGRHHDAVCPDPAGETTSAWSLWTSPPRTPPSPVTYGGRPRSSTAATCRPSTTRTATVSAFAGLSERLDHLVDLGVSVVWLMRFYPIADVDDGYDITDFYTVDPRLGSLGDFVEIVRSAQARGLKGHRRPGGQPRQRRSPEVSVGALEPGAVVPAVHRP